MHHGSLDHHIRQETEETIKQARVVVCVATSTLEIGIDIGDIDLIVLAETPWSVSALIQRVGRGKRRAKKIHAAAIAKSAAEKIILEKMFEIAKDGSLPIGEYNPDLSVAVQQIFSILYQYPGGVKQTDIIKLLLPITTSEQTKQILSHLHQKDWIEWRTERWFASTKLMDRGDRGYIHSNIPDSQAYQVIDIASGKCVGTIAGVFDHLFVLGRMTWKLESVKGNSIFARRYREKQHQLIFSVIEMLGHFIVYCLPISDHSID